MSVRAFAGTKHLLKIFRRGANPTVKSSKIGEMDDRSKYDCYDDDEDSVLFCTATRLGGNCATSNETCKASCDICELKLQFTVLSCVQAFHCLGNP